MTNLKLVDSSTFGIRCGIVLSAGNGTRLRELVHQRRGDDLPKQYVNFVGSRSMLEQRETVSDAVARAGFPPVYLAPVNFDAIYLQRMQQAKEQAAPKIEIAH